MMNDEYEMLLVRIGADTHDDAIKQIDRLKERSAILSMIMERLDVTNRWDVPDAFNKLARLKRDEK